MTEQDILRNDRSGMYNLLTGFPAQWQKGKEVATEVDPGFSVRGKDQIVIAGMGGSAIGGDLLRTLAFSHADLPVSVSRGYTLPASVTSNAVVFISSFSGNTEETLSAMEDALNRKATVVCVASGGAVIERAKERNLVYVQIPGGMPPRAALGYSLASLLMIAGKVGILETPASAWSETQSLLEKQTQELADLSGNRALDLADELTHRLPFIYSGSVLTEAVNLRWRCQINENSKKLAAGNYFPELNHNEIMGWEESGERGRDIGVVVLRDQSDPPRVQQRIDVTRVLLADRVGFWTEIHSEGNSELARLMSLVNLGDWVSFYLAMLLDVDPTPIGMINKLKETLA